MKNRVKWISHIFFCYFTFSHIPLLALDIQGHRGARGALPENSLFGFSAAIAAGVNTLELDVGVTSDGFVVVNHDLTINTGYCTNFDGSIKKDKLIINQLTLAEIKKFDCGSVKNFEFNSQIPVTGIKIPTLDEVFSLLEYLDDPRAKTVKLNIELKRSLLKPHYTLGAKDFAKTVYETVKRRGFLDRVVFSSFDPYVLYELRVLSDESVLGVLYDQNSLEIIRVLTGQEGIVYLFGFAKAIKAQILSPEHSFLKSKDVVKYMQHEGFKVITWTVNDFDRFTELEEMGVDGIITDYPLEMIDKSINRWVGF